MTVLVAKEIFCDGECGGIWERLNTPNMRKEWPGLKKKGWTRKDGNHYCPGCSRKRLEQKGSQI